VVRRIGPRARHRMRDMLQGTQRSLDSLRTHGELERLVIIQELLGTGTWKYLKLRTKFYLMADKNFLFNSKFTPSNNRCNVIEVSNSSFNVHSGFQV
jgi:hypothetical protein